MGKVIVSGQNSVVNTIISTTEEEGELDMNLANNVTGISLQTLTLTENATVRAHSSFYTRIIKGLKELEAREEATINILASNGAMRKISADSKSTINYKNDHKYKADEETVINISDNAEINFTGLNMNLFFENINLHHNVNLPLNLKFKDIKLAKALFDFLNRPEHDFTDNHFQLPLEHLDALRKYIKSESDVNVLKSITSSQITGLQNYINKHLFEIFAINKSFTGSFFENLPTEIISKIFGKVIYSENGLDGLYSDFHIEEIETVLVGEETSGDHVMLSIVLAL